MCVEQAGWGIGSGVMDKLGEHIRGWGSGFRKEKPIGLGTGPSDWTHTVPDATTLLKQKDKDC